ncbi:MAG TPA: enoyl-CoA hydratase/isomerase family protein [Ignavibacteriaceae bacterium]|nr:enoyl-CoA hydratase/isomerase family protein [Ignavibacteriaceae bacterium]
MIKYLKENGIGILSLNRPEKRNALHPEMVSQVKTKLFEVKDDNDVRILIITGEGKSFCAGADLTYLQQLANNSVIDNQKDSESLAELFLQIYKFPKPTIAAVNGAAIAGGCGLASVCDFIIADETNSKFGYSEVKIGFIPAIVSIFLVKKIGEGRAKQLLMTGEIIDGKKAFQLGLANYISTDVIAKAKDISGKLLNNSAYSMELTKSMIHNISNLNVKDALEYCIGLNTISRSSDDFEKGLSSFLNKK